MSVSQTEADVCSLCAFEVRNKTAVRKGNPVKWPKLASDMIFNFCGWTCVFLCSVEGSIEVFGQTKYCFLKGEG